MRLRAVCGLILFFVGVVPVARGQYLAIGGGGVFSQDLSSESQILPLASTQPTQIPISVGSGHSNFTASGLLAVDAGIGFFPLFSAGLHYSYARPELSLTRGDFFGSSALVNLSAHTLTFDARLRTPEIVGYHLYGLLGGGFSRFTLDVKRQVEVPFPGGAPDDALSPVFTFGGGIEKSVSPLVRLKLEVRDYVTGVSETLFRPGGAWHRVAVIGGIVLGR
ncbi:MAG: hypothetical protein HYS38_05630 [Acidobacteria bacterium]|nr:hypothetical protein [Acidobacteriota bacterium]